MDYFFYDINSIRTELEGINKNSAAIERRDGHIASSLNKLTSVMESGFTGIQCELTEVNEHLDNMLDVLTDITNTQFIQNEYRNQLLASIDATLKAPNKTVAHEKYEISLELVNKNKNEMAIKFLKEAIELNPLHYRSYIQLALNLLKIKRYEEALYYAKESVNFAPDDNEILAFNHGLIAQAYEKVNQYHDALHYINQAINYNELSEYTYARARYYAFLNDVKQAMSELNETIENNNMYFALSLVDRAFHPYHLERKALLTSLKTEIEQKLINAISQMESINFYNYNSPELSNSELKYNGFNNSTVDYRYKHLHPDFKPYKVIYVGGVERGKVSYSYHNLREEFIKHYTKLIELYNQKLPLIKSLKELNTFVDYTKAYNEYLYFAIEFNQLVSSINTFVSHFKKTSMTVKQTFRENLEFSIKISSEVKKRLQEEKRKKVFNLLGVVGAFILPINKQHDHMAEYCLEELNRRAYQVLEEAKKNVQNEEKNTVAIQHFAQEVLINKPLPSKLSLK